MATNSSGKSHSSSLLRRPMGLWSQWSGACEWFMSVISFTARAVLSKVPPIHTQLQPQTGHPSQEGVRQVVVRRGLRSLL